jgi:septal ring factor EnvC (AmiA/AmiB activator)
VDAVLTTLIGAAPQLGVGGILLTLLALLMRRESQDRADHRTQIAEMSARHSEELKQLTTRHAEELKRINTDHDVELAELRTEIKGLRDQLDEVNRKLDEERALRRAAEDSMRPRNRRTPGDAT